MWFDLATAISCSGAGVTCGWVMHALGGSGNHKLLRRAAHSVANLTATDESNKERLVQIAHRLRASASNISIAVEGYQAKVIELNDQLPQQDDPSPDRVAAVISQLIETNQQIQKRLQQVKTQMQQQTAQVKPTNRQPPVEPLTRISERDVFDQHLGTRFRLGPQAAGSLAFLEIDDFQILKDTYGHRTGDEVIKVIANLMQTRLGAPGLVAHYDADVFAVFLDGYRLEDATQRLEAVRISLGERNRRFADKSLWVSLSMGVTELLANESIEQWQQRTKDALNQSKAIGGDCGHVIQGRDLTRITRHAESRKKGEKSSSQSLGYEQPMAAEKDKLETIDEIESPTTKRAKTSHGFGSGLDDDAYLFNLETLASEFESIRGRLDAKTPIFVSAIRFTDPPNRSQKRLLLHILRAEMRCIDRLGNQGDSIFLLCMPSADAAAAQDRAKRILRSTCDALGNPRDKDSRAITIGVTRCDPIEAFHEVVDRAIGLAEECGEQEEDCILWEAEQPNA